MPWTRDSFRKHNKRLSDVGAGRAARIANAVLEKTGDEGMAIRVANARVGRLAGMMARHSRKS